MGTSATKRHNRYRSRAYTQVNLPLHKDYDSDIIGYLGEQPSKMGTIKTAIREKMAREGGNAR